MSQPGAYSLYLYGSQGRGDGTSSSDVDVLVLVGATANFDAKNFRLPSDAQVGQGHLDLTFYSDERIREMNSAGHLFAWHLFLEANHLGIGPDVLSELGEPRRYSSFEDDCLPLLNILRSVPDEIEKCPGNLTYEAGLVHVAARNIAMSASYFTNDGVTFSAFAPYLRRWSCGGFPIPRNRYEMLRKARHASTRGVTPPHIEQRLLLDDVSVITKWAECLYGRTARSISV